MTTQPDRTTRDESRGLSPSASESRHNELRTLADAWDEGYDAGDPWQRRGNPEQAKRDLNPYRRALADTPVSGTLPDSPCDVPSQRTTEPVPIAGRCCQYPNVSGCPRCGK